MDSSSSEPHKRYPRTGEAASTVREEAVPDIGVEAASSRDHHSIRAPGQKRLNVGEARSEPRRVLTVAVTVVTVALASIVFTFASGRDRNPTADPATTPAPSVVPDRRAQVDDRTVPGLATAPEPTTVMVPIVNEDFTRAGNECRLGLDAGLVNSAVFTVPAGRSMRNCRLLASSVNARLPEDALGKLWFVDQPLGHQLNALTNGEGTHSVFDVDAGSWAPVDGRRGFRFELAITSRANDWDQLQLVEVPGGTIHALRRHQPDERSSARVAESFDALVASIGVIGRDAVPNELPQPGGWCGAEHFVTRVPDTWFADESCRWLSSSSERPTVLPCECSPPLWIEHLSLGLDGDFGVHEPSVDRVFRSDDGSTVRVIEGRRRDPSNIERQVRIVVVDGGVERVAVIAAKSPKHVLPGHTWHDTLSAQQELVDSLRFHSLPECDLGERWIATSDIGSIQLLAGGHGVSVPSGSALLGTGCRRTVGQINQVEVRLEADPMVIGWVDRAVLTEPSINTCTSDGTGYDDGREWDRRIDADFDGDGHGDQVFVRSMPEIEIAAVFDAGRIAHARFVGPVIEDTAPSLFIQQAHARRVVGMGRDLLEIVTSDINDPDRVQIVSWFDLAACEPTAVFAWRVTDDDGERSGICYLRDHQTAVVRAWRGYFDRYQGWVLSDDQLWGAVDAQLSFQPSGRDGRPRCGPDLSEHADRLTAVPDNAATESTEGTALAGEHQLTLQWISVREESVGTIRFEPLGNGRYEVDGRHRGESGNELEIVGIVEQRSDSELVFAGQITSTVAWLNGGKPCVRTADQRFVARPGTSFWRLQDRINCDGGRTDWIDIEFDAT